MCHPPLVNLLLSAAALSVSLSLSGCVRWEQDSTSSPQPPSGYMSGEILNSYPSTADMFAGEGGAVPLDIGRSEPDEGAPAPLDAAPPADMMTAPPITAPDCIEGDLRQRQPCGYERCTRGAWETPASPRESCNGHDDDCDGTTDEGFNVGANCFTRVDNCSTPGEFVCNLMTQSVM